MLYVVLCPGTPKGSIGSGSGFKASQKTGQRLKVSSDKLCVWICFFSVLSFFSGILTFVFVLFYFWHGVFYFCILYFGFAFRIIIL